ncbi:glutathione S-transferase II [Cucurbitaria berberidis CBS 394.84]|uniref:Glutathione S-transferase II n=1 Tax=Cucurbitaria berberidis CBS 394.84 TaxID=1168544 RepID=A0A9P4LAD8_9PLEO|nr:glutathione S-transferase II [Cucurbitaria berberidis CBS 394.84]KAF1847099.1 glutathione S-transferase II [Cucurbitaria berberidis CBS 394.84]
MANFGGSHFCIASKGIELFTFGTPNGFKIAIFLEELKAAYGLDYISQTIDIFKNVQKEPWFTKLNPNGRIPAIVDHDNDEYVVFEGMAILNYLARQKDTEFKFSFADELEACTAEQWIAWQHGGLTPMQSQANVFYRFNPERYAFPTQHFVGETERNYGILNSRLADRDYIAGSGRGQYSIADMAIWPLADALNVSGIELSRFPNVYAWWERVGERPAVKKGVCVPSGESFARGHAKVQEAKELDLKAWEEREGPLKEALEKAQKEFGYVYKSP